jgi:hypothetical protein
MCTPHCTLSIWSCKSLHLLFFTREINILRLGFKVEARWNLCVKHEHFHESFAVKKMDETPVTNNKLTHNFECRVTNSLGPILAGRPPVTSRGVTHFLFPLCYWLHLVKFFFPVVCTWALRLYHLDDLIPVRKVFHVSTTFLCHLLLAYRILTFAVETASCISLYLNLHRKKRCQVLKAVNMSVMAFWVVNPRSLVFGDQLFGGTYRLLLQGIASAFPQI